jgi:hypothetical protein
MPAVLYSCFEGRQCANCDTPCASDFKNRQHCAEVLTALVHSDAVMLYVQVLTGSTFVSCTTGRALMCIQSVNWYTHLVNAACMGFMSGMTSLQRRRAATSGNFVTNTLEGIHDVMLQAHKHLGQFEGPVI